jgi:hypothetical protein
MDSSRGVTLQISVVPVVSTSPAYTANDQVGGIQTLTGACARTNKPAMLRSLTVTDQGKQSAALTIFFFNDLPTVASVDNGALTIVDSEMDAKCIGTVQVAAADYQSVAGSSVATEKAIGLSLKAEDATGTGNLYAVVMTTGTPTYASVSDLRFRYTLEQD